MTGPVRSVSQAFAILRLLTESGPMTLSEVGRRVGLSPSSCLNLLKTLVGEGTVERDMRTKRYRLAPAWQTVGALRDSHAARLVEAAAALLRPFAQKSEAAMGLWKIVSRDRMQLVARAESDAGMRLSLADDQRQPLGGGAAGRAIAAAQAADDAELARRYAAVRWQADLPFETYRRQIAEAAAKGFAVDQGYTHRGVCTVATGITEIAPGFCLSASIVAGSRSDAGVETLGAELLILRSDVMLRAG